MTMPRTEPFRGRVTADGAGGFKAEPGRYHLYAAWACPWAQRTAIVRTLAGLDDVVSLAYVEPGHRGRLSVPVLWDRATGRIVSNRSSDITIDLGTAFAAWADPAVRLYPPELRAEIDYLNAYLHDNVNDGVYKVAGAAAQDAYEDAREGLITALELLEERLDSRRFLHGGTITESDVRLWATLARFDLRYNPAGRISERGLTDFPNLWGYARDLYQRPAFRDTTDFSAFRPDRPPFPNDGPLRIQVEPYEADWDAPHDRERLTR